MKPSWNGARLLPMRIVVPLLAVSFALTGSAWADDTAWTAAPVPSVGGGDTVLPAARAGQPLSDDHATPFSSIPSGSVAAGGATSANRVNGIDTPNLSK